MSEENSEQAQVECKKLWTAQEIAAESGMSVKSVRRLIKRGILRPLEGTKRVPNATVIKWLECPSTYTQG